MGSPEKNKAPLKESPFVRYLGYGAEKDGYWNYEHMVVQLEDCIDCVKHLYPQFDFVFELDQSSGHARERPDGLSTTNGELNFGWGGAQRKMRDTMLGTEDVGTLQHKRRIQVEQQQKMYFTDNDLPPIFDPTAAKYDTEESLEERVKLSKKELKLLLKNKGFDDTGGIKTLQRRAEDHQLCITKLNLEIIKKAELKKMLENNGQSSDSNIDVLRARATQANLQTTRLRDKKIIPGYVGKPKGALQIACERGFITPDGLLPDKRKASLRGTVTTDPVTGVKTTDRSTSLCYYLAACHDFKTETSQMKYILNKLCVRLLLTPKCHPEIAGRGIEYSWGYSKLRFRFTFNNGVAKDIKENVQKSLAREVITTNRVRKFSRKAREYKLTYSLLASLGNDNRATALKSDIKHITKVFKAHRSAIDSNHGFIVNS